jgi:hypothetical protein
LSAYASSFLVSFKLKKGVQKMNSLFIKGVSWKGKEGKLHFLLGQARGERQGIAKRRLANKAARAARKASR